MNVVKPVLSAAKKMKANMIPKKGVSIVPKDALKKINEASRGQRKYLESMGAYSKVSSIEDVAERYVDPSLGAMVNSVGFHKVAVALMKEEGTDYGPAESLNIVKVASVIGTKLAMIHREKDAIVQGLAHLKELEA